MKRRDGFKRALGAALLALVLVTVCASAASAADPRWKLDGIAPDDIPTTGIPLRIQAWVENAGQVPLAGSLTVSDTFPAGITPVNPGFFGADGFDLSHSCDIQGQTSTCTLSAEGLAPGGQLRFLYLPAISASASGTLVNSLEVTGGGMGGGAQLEQSMHVGPAQPFAIERFGMEVSDVEGTPTVQAGSAPGEAANTLAFRTIASPLLVPGTQPDEFFEDVLAHIPEGLIGNPEAAPRCTMAQLTTEDPRFPSGKLPNCPPGSQIGTIQPVSVGFGSYGPDIVPLYNMVPPPGTPAAFGFSYQSITVVLLARLRPADNGIDLVAHKTPTSLPFSAVNTTFWGVPAEGSHDYLRNACAQGYMGNIKGETCPSEAPKTPFLRLPTSCPGTPLPWSVDVTTYSHPDLKHHAETTTPAIEGCEDVPFDPELSLTPSSGAAAGPSGLDGATPCASAGAAGSSVHGRTISFGLRPFSTCAAAAEPKPERWSWCRCVTTIASRRPSVCAATLVATALMLPPPAFEPKSRSMCRCWRPSSSAVS